MHAEKYGQKDQELDMGQDNELADNDTGIIASHATVTPPPYTALCT